MYNLTEKQKNLLRWLVEQARADRLPEEFHVAWLADGTGLITISNNIEEEEAPDITKGVLQALEENNLIHQDIRYKTDSRTSKNGRRVTQRESEKSRLITLTGNAYKAIDSDFDAPDTSFVKHLSPLADVTALDLELKQRCLPILGAGAADPQLWDSAMRTASVILEERLRDVGGIEDTERHGRKLVNAVFGKNGSLATYFDSSSELLGYRDTYVGVVGTIRNPSAHRLVDPTPEEGGAIIVFINLLLKRLEDLRAEVEENTQASS